MVPVTPEPISTTTTVHTTTVHTTTLHTTTVADIKASEVTCWIDNHEILYISLAFLSGILSTVVVFAIIYLIRKRCQKSHQNTQEQAPSQTVTEEPAKNVQNEVAYTTLVFHRAPMAV
ncbi:transmembrane protein C1orf162 homolog [Numenius arquata]|uniref:transmembrane protein C1orf162 homolog n=1 Tax=Numenius arquata TaxID=31919 RepID=UPI003D305758